LKIRHCIFKNQNCQPEILKIRSILEVSFNKGKSLYRLQEAIGHWLLAITRETDIPLSEAQRVSALRQNGKVAMRRASLRRRA
jgi:hypothetical protein